MGGRRVPQRQWPNPVDPGSGVEEEREVEGVSPLSLFLIPYAAIPIFIPIQTAAIPSTTLQRVYPVNSVHWPSSSNRRFSNANVENVVYPPQNPTIKSNLNGRLSGWLASIQPENSPIRRDPVRFTVKVPKNRK